MRRTPIWKSIADTLTTEIAEGQYGPGAKLPTEASLAHRFGVNRHTVRHALSSMAEEGLVLSRRGAGVFVAQNPTDYPIGRRVRFHQNLAAAGRVAAKEILMME
ncbi:MAG: GntR family transcriptional regulator, partial [Pseudomonadota bacterium]